MEIIEHMTFSHCQGLKTFIVRVREPLSSKGIKLESHCYTVHYYMLFGKTIYGSEKKKQMRRKTDENK
jgi:hypothetical protein